MGTALPLRLGTSRTGLSLALALALALTAACGGLAPETRPARDAVEVFSISTPPPSPEPGSCAWFGDRRNGELFFGLSPFWASLRQAGGDPRADLARQGPLWIGRFDLARERPLPPIRIQGGPGASGVWDVLAHPDGGLFFTTFFGSAGVVDPETGETRRFDHLGPYLNEWGLADGGRLLVTRYAGREGETSGSVLQIEPDGTAVAEWPLPAPPGAGLAPKTPAFDPGRGWVWLSSDRLDDQGRAAGVPDAPRGVLRPGIVLDGSGREVLRIEEAELQIAAFAPDGRGALVLAEGPEGRTLVLRELAPGPGPPDPWATLPIVLDRDFPAELDFVQELRLAEDGTWLATRWSGAVHRIDPRPADGPRVSTRRLPRVKAGGLYYTGVLHGERLCATLCAGMRVVCGPAPSLVR